MPREFEQKMAFASTYFLPTVAALQVQQPMVEQGMSQHMQSSSSSSSRMGA
jgi:hypothetical protein